MKEAKSGAYWYVQCNACSLGKWCATKEAASRAGERHRATKKHARNTAPFVYRRKRWAW